MKSIAYVINKGLRTTTVNVVFDDGFASALVKFTEF